MIRITRRWWIITMALLVLASAAAMILLSSAIEMYSMIRNPMSAFAQPGITVWWFVLGGPFRYGPDSPGGIAFAAVINVAFWLSALWLFVALARVLFRLFTRRQP